MSLTTRFQEALTFAAQLHAKQNRKGTNIPYISHLLAVASIALEYGADEDEAIAALLHDAIEDQGGAPTREEIHRRFGNRVVEIVNGCTDAEVIPKPDWRPRKEEYIKKLALASSSVLLVSASDKLHNVRTIVSDYWVLGEELWHRFSGGRETLWYYRALVDAYKAHGSSPLLDELERVVAELERLASNSQALS